MPEGSGLGRYRLLLRAYPRGFREAHEDDLLELFSYRRDERIAKRGRLGLGFWLYIVWDLIGSGWREWMHPLRPIGPGRRGAKSGGDGMRGWIDDLAYATRRLVRSPGFAGSALLILVLGIGVNTAAFSIVNALLFQPPPFADPEGVVLVLQDSDGGSPNPTSYPAFRDIAEFDQVFSGVSAFYSDQSFLQDEGTLAPIMIEYATSNYLEVLGLSPTMGTWFDPVADDPTGPPAAVITHRMWTQRLGQDPGVVGRTMRIEGGQVTVVGVGPERFNGGVGPVAVDMWLSISAMAPTGGRVISLTRRQDHPFQVRARLAPGVSMEQASFAMNQLADQLAADFPELNANRRIAVLPVMENGAPPDAAATIVPTALLSMTVVTLVLLIATMNLANLLLVRSMARARELAVRLAVGAGRGRLIRVVFSEAVVLSLVGGAAGFGLAVWFLRIISRSQLNLGLPMAVDIRLDWTVFVFASVITIATGLVFGLLPAFHATRRGVAASLREDAGSRIGARRRFGLTGVLVAAQITASLVLLAVAGVFLESLVRAQSSDPGFAHENLGFVQFNLQPLGLDADATDLLGTQLEERLDALPEVAALTASAMMPAAMFGTTTLLLPSPDDGIERPTETPWNLVADDYFDVLGMRVLHGRRFAEQDRTGPAVAIVSEAMARTYWGRADIVGESYRSENNPESPVRIIGVVSNIPVRSLGEAPSPAVYWPVAQAMPRGNYLLRPSGSVDQAIAAVQRTVTSVDERILVLAFGTMESHLGNTLTRQRTAGTLLSLLGTLALLLSVLGIYGVVAFAVSRRRREVGIRLALGARRESVLGLFVRDVAGVVVVGAVVGFGLSIPLTRLVGQEFTGAAGSPLVTAGVALLLVLTGLVATAIPAMRAARTNPTQALRAE